MLISQLSLCVIAVDWRGHPSQAYHDLRVSLGRERHTDTPVHIDVLADVYP